MKRGILLSVLLLAAPAMAGGDALTVIDGDTLHYGDERLRLFGIDAPEINQICQKDGHGWLAGEDAAAWLKSFVAGKQVFCGNVDRDRYGRRVVVCFADRADLGEAMVLNGWALAYRRYSLRYVAAEASAQRNHLGLWSGDCLAPWQYRKLQKQPG